MMHGVQEVPGSNPGVPTFQENPLVMWMYRAIYPCKMPVIEAQNLDVTCFLTCRCRCHALTTEIRPFPTRKGFGDRKRFSYPGGQCGQPNVYGR